MGGFFIFGFGFGFQDVSPTLIVLFGPTLAAMCKQCAIPVTQKASKQRSLFDSGENGGDFTLPQPRFQAVGLAIQA